MKKSGKIIVCCWFVCLMVLAVMPAALAQVALKQGSSGNEVFMLQTRLREIGYYQDEADGAFGSGTRSAVINFQLDCGLAADGVVGAQTWQALRDYRVNDTSRGQVDRRLGQRIAVYAQNFYGVPYVWAGRSPSGFDCSGFISYVFAQNGVSLPRMADEQYNVGMWVNRADLQPGDLVFFSTYEAGASHVGIYIGNGQFVHASSGAGQVVSTSLYSQYYQARYLGARRVA
ncbi:C40 family peptidase [Propionispora hippei]|uniref:Cell wall-associated hydrolase, NlpC family n=1 Tax=Propionispora hippei DSM 15287 TaxID=1123003 RepID=A0A1M6CSI0_9FIRM|nr:NlpC/P60 family protein [Propionispora hippei]SHI63823.1 Cell wall-associated hydrolase, NlpC family [Propionispora hippei DSM 15287]